MIKIFLFKEWSIIIKIIILLMLSFLSIFITLCIIKIKYDYDKIEKQIYSSVHNITKEYYNIISKLILKRMEKTFKIECIIFIISIIFLIMKIMNIGDINNYYFFLLIIIAYLILFHQGLLFYRYKREFYGTNYYEVKELVYFLIQEENKTVKFKNGKMIFNKADTNPSVELMVEPVDMIEDIEKLQCAIKLSNIPNNEEI